MRNKFIDRKPEGLGEYEWDVGYESEDPQQNTQNLERTAVTGGVGFIRQQGAPSPEQFKLHGWAPKNQIDEFEKFYKACAGIAPYGPARTIFWQDISGPEGGREVIITSFAPQRETGRWVGRGEQTNYVHKYEITLEVV